MIYISALPQPPTPDPACGLLRNENIYKAQLTEGEDHLHSLWEFFIQARMGHFTEEAIWGVTHTLERSYFRVTHTPHKPNKHCENRSVCLGPVTMNVTVLSLLSPPKFQ